MAINERLIDTKVEAAGNGGAGNAGEEGLILHLDANDVDSYDGDGSVWYDIKDHEYTPATNVDEHFNTVLYTGTGTTNSITGVGFQPDLIWIKDRNQTENHYLIDSVRGKNGSTVYENLYPNLTNAQANDNAVTSLDADGFTLQASGNGNVSGESNVAWCFKAGGAAVSNTDGDINSQVSVNNDLGFSIVSYTGNSSFGQTVGHGLDVQPQMVIHKNLSNARNWRTYVEPLGATKYINLDENAAAGTYGSFNNTAPTSTVFSTTNSVADRATNFNGDNYIAYCFTSKRGVSKVGSYTGTGATGNKVYTGFEPAFVMIKQTSGTNSWRIFDNKRGADRLLFPNLPNAEGGGTRLEFNSNGFTLISGNTAENGSGQTYIYLAFAKNTKETSLIPDTDLELHLDPTSYSGSGTTWTADVGNNATLNGNMAYDQELGDFFDLDGNGDYAVVNQSTYLDGDFTLEMWWNFDSLSGYQMLWGGLGYGPDAPNGLGHYINNNTIQTWIQINNSGSNPVSSGAVLSTNKWHHIVLTRSGGTYTQYLDGNQVGTGSGSSGSLACATARIGGSSTTNLYDVDGRVGQVRVYDTALTQDQIRQNYNFTKNNYPNGYDGTISGATWNSGGYFDFDGSNDYVDTNLLYKENNTVSMWVNFTSNSAVPLWGVGESYYKGIYCAIIDDQDSAHNDYTVYFWIREGASAYNYQRWTNVTLNSYGNWNFLTFRMEQLTGTNFYMSVNGGAEQQSVNHLSAGTITATPNDGINIGRAYNNGVWFYGNSKISKFKVHDKTLTQAEITALYNEGE